MFSLEIFLRLLIIEMLEVDTFINNVNADVKSTI